MAEDPLKEMRCHAYLTELQKRTKEVPEQLPGDLSRILPMADCLEDSTAYYLVMPCLERDLYSEFIEDYLNQGLCYSEPKAFHYFSQIVCGLEAVHSLQLVHRDLSLENLLLDGKGGVYFIDWGLVTSVHGLRQPPMMEADRIRAGKLMYREPERLFGSLHIDPFKLDIWACGVILFLLLTGRPTPFYLEPLDPVNRDNFIRIIDGNIDGLLVDIGASLSPQAIQLLQVSPSYCAVFFI